MPDILKWKWPIKVENQIVILSGLINDVIVLFHNLHFYFILNYHIHHMLLPFTKHINKCFCIGVYIDYVFLCRRRCYHHHGKSCFCSAWFSGGFPSTSAVFPETLGTSRVVSVTTRPWWPKWSDSARRWPGSGKWPLTPRSSRVSRPSSFSSQVGSCDGRANAKRSKCLLNSCNILKGLKAFTILS